MFLSGGWLERKASPQFSGRLHHHYWPVTASSLSLFLFPSLQSALSLSLRGSCILVFLPSPSVKSGGHSADPSCPLLSPLSSYLINLRSSNNTSTVTIYLPYHSPTVLNLSSPLIILSPLLHSNPLSSRASFSSSCVCVDCLELPSLSQLYSLAFFFFFFFFFRRFYFRLSTCFHASFF